ncbi:hypothetical protein TNCV_4619581 [Trichonephila clavipes]|nr:hypothetical protein TNCV_4619581 [Trichonephila clavipes]
MLFVDIAKAFDKIWRNGLLSKMVRFLGFRTNSSGYTLYLNSRINLGMNGIKLCVTRRRGESVSSCLGGRVHGAPASRARKKWVGESKIFTGHRRFMISRSVKWKVLRKILDLHK